MIRLKAIMQGDILSVFDLMHKKKRTLVTNAVGYELIDFLTSSSIAENNSISGQVESQVFHRTSSRQSTGISELGMVSLRQHIDMPATAKSKPTIESNVFLPKADEGIGLTQEKPKPSQFAFWSRLDLWFNFFAEFKDSDRTKDIARAIWSLDELARKIDSNLDLQTDSDFDQETLLLSVIGSVQECILPILKYTECSEDFIDFQIEKIKESIEINTTLRKVAYAFIGSPIQKSTTLDYLWPVFSLLDTRDELSEQLRSFFIVFSQIVQILDDVNDYCEDVSQNISTPFTELVSRYDQAVSTNTNFCSDLPLRSIEIALDRIIDLSCICIESLKSMETERIVGIVEVDFVKLIKALSGKGRLEIRIEGWPGWQKMHDRVPLVFCYG